MWTPLHVAASKGHLAVCKLLLQHFAHANIANDDEKTALDVAKNDTIRVAILQALLQQQQQEYILNANKDQMKINQLQNEKNALEQELVQNQKSNYNQLEQRVKELGIEKAQLEQEVELLKQNQYAGVMGEVKIMQLKQYEKLMQELLEVQTKLVSVNDKFMRSNMVEQRNKTRRDIVECINSITEEVKFQMVKNIEKIAEQMIAKKLEQFLFIKNELEKDIAKESIMKGQIENTSLQQLEAEMAELERDLRTYRRRGEEKEKVEEIEEEIRNIKLTIQEHKQVISFAMTKRVNSLFGFPEFQSFILNTINQEKIEDLQLMYSNIKDEKLFLVATRKDNNTKVFVKKFSKLNEWRQFKNEVEIVKRLNHQCVITINRVMYDDDLYYVEMPFFSNGTLYDWLFKSHQETFATNIKNERSGFEVQQMLRFVIQTIDYLHENGVIHRDIKIENIMMQTEQLPIIIDFDMSKDNHITETIDESTMKGGTLKYMDPAVQWSVGVLNSSSDIYSFGVTMLKCFSKYPIKADVFAMPSKEFPDLKMSDFIIEDEDLIQLLKRCLHIKQEQRPSAQEIIYSPFFLKHLSNDNAKGLTTKIGAFKKYMTDKRKNHKSEVCLKLNPDILLEQLSQLVIHSSIASLYKQFTVKFEGQDGIDQGALTTSMFRKYFEQLVVKKLLVQGSNCFHICEDQSLVAMDENMRKTLMIAIGIMMCKCLYELRSIGDIELSSVLIRYLIADNSKSLTVNMSDYESFDVRMSNQLSNLYLYHDLSDLCLDFSGLKENGANIELTSENLSEYIQLTIQNEMINKRRQNLEWIKEGFFRMSELKEHLQMLEVNDYHILLTGEQMIDIPSIVANCTVFIGFDDVPTQQQQQLYLNLQNWMREVLIEMSQEEFKLFLLFCTGHSRTETKDTLFSNGNLRRSGYALDKINIKVIKEWNINHLPQSHVCFYLLDLPLYTNKQQLEQKLKLAISHSNDSFTMA